MKTIDDADYVDGDICPWSMALDCPIAPKQDWHYLRNIDGNDGMMTMTELYLMALIGKNMPVLLLVSK